MCYNVITSERFFFFAKNRLTVKIRTVLSDACRQVRQITEPREAFTFTAAFCLPSKSKKYFRKAGGAVMRVKITLACTECKQRNYNTMKNKKNDPDRLEMNKYCRFCRKHTLHKETK